MKPNTAHIIFLVILLAGYWILLSKYVLGIFICFLSLLGYTIYHMIHRVSPISDIHQDLNRPLPLIFRIIQYLYDWFEPNNTFYDPKSLIQMAKEQTNLTPNFPAEVLHSLTTLCDSINKETHLNWLGRNNMKGLIVSGLAGYLRLEQIFRFSPKLDKTPLDGIIFIVGFPRSGTTFLHRLLANGSQFRTIPLWEHFHAIPHDQAVIEDLDEKGVHNRGLFSRLRLLMDVLYRRFLSLEFYFWLWIGNHFGVDAMHVVRPSYPDECNFLMRLSLLTPLFWDTASVHSYKDWIESDSDRMEFSYQIYRKTLQYIQANSPGKTLLLKCPYHAVNLNALAKVFPEAKFLFAHRSLKESLSSSFSLSCRLQAINTKTGKLDWKRTVQADIQRQRLCAKNLIDVADKDDSNPQAQRKIYHVTYKKLTKEPLTVVREIHSQFGMSLSSDDEKAMTDYVQTHKQHQYGRHKHSFTGLELNEMMVEQEPDFQNYMTRFQQYIE